MAVSRAGSALWKVNFHGSDCIREVATGWLVGWLVRACMLRRVSTKAPSIARGQEELNDTVTVDTSQSIETVK